MMQNGNDEVIINDVDQSEIQSSIEEIDEKVDQGNTEITEVKDLLEANHNDQQKGFNDLMAEYQKSESNRSGTEAADYTTEIQYISDQLELSNEIYAGQTFMLGVLTGVILFRILFDRLRA